MIKHFCDLCDEEITSANKPTGGNAPGRLGTKKQNVGFSVMLENTLFGGTPDVCKYCIIDAIKSLDDRPRAA